jgi:tRNA (pseudouridine54-N1)-methyltransferase
MKTFIIRARKGTTQPDKIHSLVGSKEHFEVVLHSMMNAFFVASGFREDVEVCVVLDSSKDFPKTIRLSSATGLSLPGFHETAMMSVIQKALMYADKVSQDAILPIGPGIDILGYGFEKLVKSLMETRPIFTLEPKGEAIQKIDMPSHPVFILSDHLAMPKKIMLSLKRKGLLSLSLGKRMLFASQCITLIHHYLDGQGI